MALVELFRVTGERRWLELATSFIDRRGRGWLGDGRFGRGYWQDHLPVREAPAAAGHAVRQMYLDSGAVDVAIETGDDALLDAVHRRWRDMVATKTYLTGALGSRHKDEAFGDPFELPPDRAYAETCAAIASTMLAWRLLLATGDPACADLIERTVYNAVLPSLSTEGTAFFYVNPLQRRTHRTWTAPGDGERAPWYACACCPPNLMRLIGSWHQMLATDGRRRRPRPAVRLRGGRGGRPAAGADDGLSVGRRRPGRDPRGAGRRADLAFRVPAWCSSATLRDRADGAAARDRPPDGAAIVADRGSGGRATRSTCGWTSCRASRARILASTRSAAASRWSAGRSCTRSSPRTCRRRRARGRRDPPDGAAPRDAAAPAHRSLDRRPERSRPRPPARRSSSARSRTSPGRIAASAGCGSGSREPGRDVRCAPRRGRRGEPGDRASGARHAVVRQRVGRRP